MKQDLEEAANFKELPGIVASYLLQEKSPALQRLIQAGSESGFLKSHTTLTLRRKKRKNKAKSKDLRDRNGKRIFYANGKNRIFKMV
ncbi:MAG: hypothetical protein HFE84_09010 [Lachnospiraceae bacterium]|nr:hypothetical protein [Lachnospiraceae bacterium]